MAGVPLYLLAEVTQSYGERTVLNVPSLEIRPATITGLVGANGSGKSTLLDLLAFIRSPARGTIRINGQPARPFDEHVREARITLLNQDVYLLKRSVARNVAYGLKVRGDLRRRDRRIAEALDEVGLPPALFARRPWYALSGGEAQRVALAARLVLRPRVLLLDEPTASVDDRSARLIKQAALSARRRWGTTLVIASHDVHWLHTICDDIVYLHGGRVQAAGFVTAIDGPWHPEEPGIWVRRLPDGQCIRAVGADGASESATVLVDAGKVSVRAAPTSVDGRENRLRGTLTRLLYEKRTEGLIATVDVGPLSLTCRVSGETASAAGGQPGRSVYVCFSMDAVRWHAAED